VVQRRRLPGPAPRLRHRARRIKPLAHGNATLALRPNGECCDRDLPPESPDARICSYECTFCAACVQTRLRKVCPNRGGNFERRPVRPAAKLAQDAASTTRVLA